MAKLNDRTTAILSLLFIVIIWGSAATVTKVGVSDIPPFLFAFLRNLVSSISLLPIYFFRRKKLAGQQQVVPKKRIIWMGLTGITAFYLFFNLGLVYTSAATGALIQGFIPVAIILLALIFLKEKISKLHFAGIALSVTGVILIGFIGTSTTTGTLGGNVLIVLSVVAWGIYTILAKTVREYDPIIVASLTIFYGTAFLVPAMLIENWGKSIPVITTSAWLAILYLGLFSSTICYILYNRVLKVLPAVQVGNFMNLDPVIGAAIAVIALHDRLTSWQLIGTGLVLAGIFLSSREKH